MTAPTGTRTELQAKDSWLRRWRRFPQLLQLLWELGPRDMLVLAAASLINGLRPLLSFIILQQLVDSAAALVMGRTAISAVLLWLAALFVIEALQVILDLSYGMIEEIHDRLKARVHEQILRKSSRLSLAAFEQPAVYDQLQRAQQVLETRLTSLLEATLSLPMYIVQALSLLIYVGAAHVYFPIVIVCSQAIAYGAYTHAFRLHYWLDHKHTPSLRLLRYLGNLMSERRAAAEIRLFSLQEHLLGRYQSLYKHLQVERLKLARDRQRTDLFRVVGKAINTGLVAIGLVVLVAQNLLSVGAFVAFLSAAERLSETIAMIITWGIGQADNDLRYMNDLFEFLERDDEEQDKREAVSTAAEQSAGPRFEQVPAIVFDAVSFAYPGTERQVLDRLTLTLAPGERVALVGENGAGKTTLAKLLLGLYRPTAGRILVDGVDLNSLDQQAWRRQVAAVFQDYVKYELSARENIGYGDLAQLNDVASIDTAAAKSGADQVIMQLPKGYETMLGRAYDEQGHDLSIGQWQKLAIARAYLRNGMVLVLDEPTAALDARAEVDVYRQFRNMAEGRSVLLISHRLGSARLADRIVVLEYGQIVEEGTHAELLGRGGQYAELYAVQAEWYI